MVVLLATDAAVGLKIITLVGKPDDSGGKVVVLTVVPPYGRTSVVN